MIVSHRISARSVPATGFRGVVQPLAVAAWLACFPLASWAATPSATTSTATPAAAPQQVVITGNPLSADLTQPASQLSGDALTLRLAPTLGETLDGLPGVASTWFGPNSNRPTIRGLDGDRVRMLDNGGASPDASNLSFDHAVALDPLVVERLEVLRGPAALLYGGNAMGGVVNTVDNRIPRNALDGLDGRMELRAGGAAHERSGSALLEGGAQGLNWHVDGFRRETGNLSAPRYVPQADGVALPATSQVRNSAANTSGGAVGASWADADGYLGASVDTYGNRYGVTVEPDVHIQMQRQRVALAAERDLGTGWLRHLEMHLGHTTYQHDELEASGEVGTRFNSDGTDLRLELRHRGLLGQGPADQGVVGIQAESLDFSALGEEAFVPDTQSRNAALFALEEVQLDRLRLMLGGRVEQASVESSGDGSSTPAGRFGPAQTRHFTPMSASLQAHWPLAPGWTLSSVLGSTQRAPAYYELFANGLHVATAAFEKGNTDLGVERGVNADLGLNWKQGADKLELQAFAMRFANFIALQGTGARVDDGDGSTVPQYQFTGVRAQLWGLELDGRKRLNDQGWTVDLLGGLDLTHGRNIDTGEALPRLAPVRMHAGLELGLGDWQLSGQLRHAWAQNRVPADDTRTPGYTLVNLSASFRQRWSAGLDAFWFLKLDNLGNQLAYSASAIQTVRELSPLPGRSVSAGLRLSF